MTPSKVEPSSLPMPPLPVQVILLFQNIDGVDLCLYCLYMQEYGEDAPAPNRKSGECAAVHAVHWRRDGWMGAGWLGRVMCLSGPSEAPQVLLAVQVVTPAARLYCMRTCTACSVPFVPRLRQVFPARGCDGGGAGRHGPAHHGLPRDAAGVSSVPPVLSVLSGRCSRIRRLVARRRMCCAWVK